MQEQLQTLKQEVLMQIEQTDDMQELKQIMVNYLGKKGSLTKVLRGMGKLEKEESSLVNERTNHLRESITTSIEEKYKILEEKASEEKIALEAIDVTLPCRSM